MDLTNFFSISGFAVFQVLVLTILLFFGFRLLRKLLEKLVRLHTNYIFLLRLFSLSELIVWLVFVYWAFQWIFGQNQFFTYFYIALLTAVFIWTFWFALKDLIAGVVLKTQDVYRISQTIKIDQLEGKIRSIGHLNIELELKDGQIVKIPFGKITGHIHSKTEQTPRNRLHSFSIRMNKSRPVNETIDQLRFLILTLPWVTQNSESQIQFKREDEDSYHFEISVNTISDRFQSNIEKTLKNLV